MEIVLLIFSVIILIGYPIYCNNVDTAPSGGFVMIMIINMAICVFAVNYKYNRHLQYDTTINEMIVYKIKENDGMSKYNAKTMFKDGTSSIKKDFIIVGESNEFKIGDTLQIIKK